MLDKHAQQTLALREKAAEVSALLEKRLARLARTSQAEPVTAEFARLLNNLSLRLSALGRREEALAKAQEAEGIYRQLAQARPDAFFEHWTMSLWTLALCQRALEHHAEACTSFHQALVALAPAFQRRPERQAPLMARILRAYSQSAEQARQQPDMELLAPIVESLQKLQANQPKA